MAATLPPADKLRPPAWALARVPGLAHGERPRALMRLAGGSVNEVYRVDSVAGRFVLRLDGAAWRRPGVERGRELVLHRLAADAGIAPTLIDAEPSLQGLLITAYEPGRTWSGADFEDIAALRRLGERLYALHRLPAPDLPPFDPWQVAQDYVRLIEPSGSTAVWRQQLETILAPLQRSCSALLEGAPAACIVHGDLVHSNLLQGSRLWLLDWEYAQLSDPLMDLACILAYYPGVARHLPELAAAAGLATAARPAALAPRLYVYRALSWLWHLARGEYCAAPQDGA